MIKDEALDVIMKQYSRLHYPDDCKTFTEGYDAGWTNAEQNLTLSFLSERHFCHRCGKRIYGLFGNETVHTCTPPTTRKFDNNGYILK